jgi:iron complex outermembrane recepter protein
VVVIPVVFRNGLEGNSRGVEVAADVRPVERWRLTANYSHLRVDLSKLPGSTDVSQERRGEGLSPRHQVQFRSSLDIGSTWTVDWFLRYVSELQEGPVPAYATSNVRVGWRITPQVELSVVGRDLHSARHVEWGGASGIPVRRTGHVQVAWRN